MTRKEVVLLVVAVAGLVQGQQQHQLAGCQQRCGQFYLDSQQVKYSYILKFYNEFISEGGVGITGMAFRKCWKRS